MNRCRHLLPMLGVLLLASTALGKEPMTVPLPDRLELQLSAKAAPVRRRVEIRITNIDLPEGVNPDAPEQISVHADIETPSGKTITLPGFWYQPYRADPGSQTLKPHGRGGYVIRFAPLEAGKHTGTVHVGSGGNSAKASFALTATAAPADDPGYVRIDPERPRYFRRSATGEAFFAIGGHLFDRLLPVTSPPDKGDFDADGPTPEFLYRIYKKMADHLVALDKVGVNAVRIRTDSWWLALELETPKVLPLPGFPKGQHGLTPGRYFGGTAWIVDQLISECEKRGIAVQLCTWNPNVANNWGRRWSGKMNTYYTYAKDPANETLVKRRLRYHVARWSAFTSLAAWEYFNEIGHGWNGTPLFDIHDAYWKGVTEWLRRTDPYDHIVTNSAEGVDIHDVHMYLEKTNFFNFVKMTWVKRGGDWVEAPEWRHTVAMFLKDPERPFQLGEYGIRFHKGAKGREQKRTPDYILRHVREGLWCSIASGKAGAYAWRTRNLQKAELLKEVYAPAAAYLADERLGAFTWKAAEMKLPGEDELLATGMVGDGRRALLFFVRTPCDEVDDRKPLTDASITLIGLKPGAYQLQWWSVTNGKATSQSPLTVGADGVAGLSHHRRRELEDPGQGPDGRTVRHRDRPSRAEHGNDDHHQLRRGLSLPG